jgi:hypothetical protein
MSSDRDDPMLQPNHRVIVGEPEKTEVVLVDYEPQWPERLELERSPTASPAKSSSHPRVMTALLDGRRARRHRHVPRARGRTRPAGRGRAFRFEGARTHRR